jgi:hypothetical protein
VIPAASCRPPCRFSALSFFVAKTQSIIVAGIRGAYGGLKAASFYLVL